MENTSMAHGEPEAPISAPGVGVTCLRFATGNPARFIYLDPDYASKDTTRYPWLTGA